jgi:cyanate lyase
MLQSQTNQASRIDLTNTILEAKAQKGISFEELANGTGLNVAFVTAALLGQHPLPTEAAKVVGKQLQLHENAVALLQTIPWRGSIPGGTPTDPTVYRFYEVLQVYGSTLKALINEKFGDGIMSGINFRLGIDKVEDPEGGWRVVITLNGKFFPIKPY